MSKYDRVKMYYERGNWTLDQVHNAVGKGWISKLQYEEITGKPYVD